jgi:site-specific recombinase XerD
LFHSQKGRGLGNQAVEQLVSDYAWQAGLEDVTPDTLRYTVGHQLLDCGVDLVTVSAFLGHERLETTASYPRPGPRDLERAVQKRESGSADDERASFFRLFG